MDAVEAPPADRRDPGLPKRERSWFSLHPRRLFASPLGLLFGLVLGAAVVRAAYDWGLPLPRCMFKTLTGLPCAFCGSTRALLAATHLDPARAFALNPLASLIGCGLCLWAGLWAGDCWAGGRTVSALQRWFRCLPLTWVLIGLAVLNWLYLLIWRPA